MAEHAGDRSLDSLVVEAQSGIIDKVIATQGFFGACLRTEPASIGESVTHVQSRI